MTEKLELAINIKDSGIRFILSQDYEDIIRDLKYSFGYQDSHFGEIVYHRTYSRIKEDGSQENWPDTVIRVINGIFTIRKWWFIIHNLPWNEESSQEKAFSMACSMLQMLWLPPGRGLWSMGTDYIYERGSMALYNCAFIEIKDLSKDICWLMDALMCGCGVGFGIIDKPQNLTKPLGAAVLYTIPDSREGWVESVKMVIDSYLIPNSAEVLFNYDKIRKYGEPIKGFGGTASGPDPLRVLHQRIVVYCEEYIKGKINWTHLIANLANAVGVCVVAGNVRRSAEIALGSPTDESFINLKNYNLYPNRNNIGWMSNNSCRLITRNDFLRLSDIAEQIKENGEPGVYNALNVQKYARYGDESYGTDPATGMNPCGEIPLESYELCNLSEVFPSRCSSRKEFLNAIDHATFYSSTVSLYPTHSPYTNAVIACNRRIGVSLSGIAEWIDTWGIARCTRWIKDGYHLVRQVNKEVNEKAGVPPSIRVTTVKPSGCRPKEALTSTSRGILTLDELLENHPNEQEWHTTTNTLALQGEHKTPITKTYKNGISETVNIHLSYGMKLTSTPNHQWFVSKTHKPSIGKRWKEVNEWKRADELSIGDVIDITLDGYRNTHHKKLNCIELSDYNGITYQINQPEYLSEDLSWLLGYLWGDGSMSPLKYRIRFCDGVYENLKKAQRLVEQIFGLRAEIYPQSGDRNSWELCFASKNLWDWCIANGIWKYHEDENRYLANIPRVVRESSHEDILAFISGLIDSDGSFFEREERYSFSIQTSDKDFAEHLQHICWSVGIGVGNSLNSEGDNKQEEKELYFLTIASSYFDENCLQTLINNSNKLVGSPYQYKGKKVTKFSGKVEKLEQGRTMETFDIETGNHWYYAGSVKSHNTISQLAGVPSGMHFPTFQHAIRRLIVDSGSLLAAILREAGYPCEPTVEFLTEQEAEGRIYFEKYEKFKPSSDMSPYMSDNSLVFECPIKQGQARPAQEVSAWEQFALLAMLQREWSDNSVSCTVYFNETETLQIPQMLTSFVPVIKSVSMLPHSNKGSYPQMPYEGISEEEYNERIKSLKELDWSRLKGSDGNQVAELYCSSDRCELIVK